MSGLNCRYRRPAVRPGTGTRAQDRVDRVGRERGAHRQAVHTLRPRVFASRRFPDRVREELERSFELDLHDSEWPLEREELLRRVAGKDGLMLMLTDRVDDELLDAAGPQLRVVANYAVGIDNVDLEACRRRGVVVSNTPDVLTETTAELTIALILALLRRVAEGDRLIRRGEALDLGAEPDARPRPRGLDARAWSATAGSARRSSGWRSPTEWSVVHTGRSSGHAARRAARDRRRRLAPPAADRRDAPPDRRAPRSPG